MGVSHRQTLINWAVLDVMMIGLFVVQPRDKSENIGDDGSAQQQV